MMMIVDGSGASVSFDEMASGLDEIGTGIGVNIKCQREEIFTKCTVFDRRGKDYDYTSGSKRD